MDQTNAIGQIKRVIINLETSKGQRYTSKNEITSGWFENALREGSIPK
jgi:hypothetical protein